MTWQSILERMTEYAKGLPAAFAGLTRWQKVAAVIGAAILLYVVFSTLRSWIFEARVAWARVAMDDSEKFVRVYAGRLSMEVPATCTHGAKVYMSGPETSFGFTRSTQIWVTRWPIPLSAAAEEHEAELKRQWDEYTEKAQFAAGREQGQDEDWLVVADEELKPDLRWFVFQDSSTSPGMRAKIMLLRGDRLVDIEVEPSVGGMSYDPFRALAETREYARGLLRRIDDLPRDASGGFGGAPQPDDMLVDSLRVRDTRYNKREDTGFGASGHPVVSKLSVDAMFDPQKTPNIVKRAADIGMRAVSLAMGVRFSSVRSGGLKLGGLDGHEVITIGKQIGKPEQSYFVWEYQGTGDMPDIQITMEGTGENMAEKTAYWDRMLSSFQWHGPRDLGKTR